jgi:hypothetical protein
MKYYNLGILLNETKQSSIYIHIQKPSSDVCYNFTSSRYVFKCDILTILHQLAMHLIVIFFINLHQVGMHLNVAFSSICIKKVCRYLNVGFSSSGQIFHIKLSLRALTMNQLGKYQKVFFGHFFPE